MIPKSGYRFSDKIMLKQRSGAGWRFEENHPALRTQREDDQMGPFQDIGVERSGFVTLIEIRRPPNNFFDIALIREIAGALEALDQDPGCRAIVLASQGTAFCAGSNFGDGGTLDREGQRPG